MPTPSGHTTPPWPASAQLPAYGPLGDDLDVDVCVVGAGIAGLTTAYLLGRAGRRVAVLDDNAIGGGETGRTTAHLASAVDDRFHTIERLHGERGSRLTYESHAAAIDAVERIAREEQIDCDFERLDGLLFAGGDDDRTALERELVAARRAGVAGVALLERAPVDAWGPEPCLRFPRQAQFHPLRYLAGLALAIERDGGRIFTGSHVASIDADGERPTARTDDGHTVRADALVVATNSPINDWIALHTKQAAYRTFAIGLRVTRGAVARALYWDTADPYHYVRVAAADDGGELLIVGGEDHKTGQADDGDERFARLERWARERFPQAAEVACRWSGQVMEPVDHVAFIGRDPAGQRNVYVATGDSGMGMTHGTIAGLLLTDLVTGTPNAWETLYDPARRTLRAALDFARENVNVARQFADYVTPAEVDSTDDIAPGCGALVRDGASKIAAYKDEDGTVVRRSAVCTHLWCIVHWNDAEKSWDCPCHGSRFAPTGEVLNGPAAAPLGEVE